MARVGQLRVGGIWIGRKERDMTAAGNHRYYDKRWKSRIILGAVVRGKFGKCSIFRVSHGNGTPWDPYGRIHQHHYKYKVPSAPPGSDLAANQAVFREAMAEIKLLTPEQRAPYKVMELDNFNNRHRHPGTYKAWAWPHFYLMERLPVLYHLHGII